MVIEASVNSSRAESLPPQATNYMTQLHREELVPEQIGRAGSQVPALLDSLHKKPAWLPASLEWGQSGKFEDLYHRGSGSRLTTNPSTIMATSVKNIIDLCEDSMLVTSTEALTMPDEDITTSNNAEADHSSENNNGRNKHEMVTSIAEPVTEQASENKSIDQVNDAKDSNVSNSDRINSNNDKAVQNSEKEKQVTNSIEVCEGTKASECSKQTANNSDLYNKFELIIDNENEETKNREDSSCDVNIESDMNRNQGDGSVDAFPAIDLRNSPSKDNASSHQVSTVSADVLKQIDEEIFKSIHSTLKHMNSSGKVYPLDDYKNLTQGDSSLSGSVKRKAPAVSGKGKPRFRSSGGRALGKVGERLRKEDDAMKSLSDSELTSAGTSRKKHKQRSYPESFMWKTETVQLEPTSVTQAVYGFQGSIDAESVDKEKRSVKAGSDPSVKVVEQKKESKYKPESDGKKYNSSTASTSGQKHEDDVVWICFICAKSFPNQSSLMDHQDICEEVEEMVDTVFKSTSPGNADTKPDVDFITAGMVSDSLPTLDGQHSADIKPIYLNDSVASTPAQSPVQPVPTLLRKVGSSLKSLPLGLPSKSRMIRRRQNRFPDVYIPPSGDVYFECLGLLQTPKVQAISCTPRKSVTDEDCQIIDLTDDSQTPTVPLTPRSRSLISQLSRDDTGVRRRQLSFSQSSSQVVIRASKVAKTEGSEQDSSDSMDSGDRDRFRSQKVPPKSAILGIPLTSPLGQRLKQHWNSENKVPVLKDIEEFCNTNNVQIEKQEKAKNKNPMTEKLRNRPPPQCTFRFSKKYMNKWAHSYKFNKADKHEFVKRLRTGLDRDSRLRRKRMKPCKVVLERMSKNDIKYWTTPRPKYIEAKSVLQGRPNQTNLVYYTLSTNPPRYLSRPMFSQQQQYGKFSSNIPGIVNHRPLSPGFPTPQLLVRAVSVRGQGGMQMQVVPMQNTTIPLQNLFTSPGSAHSQKRKQVFSGVRSEDAVICLSSSEEEDNAPRIISKPAPSACAMCAKSNQPCSIHARKKIGPASFMKNQHTRRERCQSLNEDSNLYSTGRSGTLTKDSGSLSKSASTVNSIHGTSFQKLDPAKPVQSTHVRSADFTNIKIVNGTVVNEAAPNCVDNSASQGAREHAENLDVDVTALDNDYMDYEVICIDSDEEN